MDFIDFGILRDFKGLKDLRDFKRIKENLRNFSGVFRDPKGFKDLKGFKREGFQGRSRYINLFLWIFHPNFMDFKEFK